MDNGSVSMIQFRGDIYCITIPKKTTDQVVWSRQPQHLTELYFSIVLHISPLFILKILLHFIFISWKFQLFFFFFTWSCKMKKNAHTFICFFFHSWPQYLECYWNSDTADSWVGIFWNNYKVMYAHLVNSLCFYAATKVLSQDYTAFLREQQSSQFPQQASPSAVRRSRTQQECVLRDVCGKSSQQI